MVAVNGVACCGVTGSPSSTTGSSSPADISPNRLARAITHATRCGHTPSPRGDAPPDAARPAQLAGLRTHRHTPSMVFLLAVASQPQRPLRTSAVDGGRSCIPLRDSPGISPGSLSRRILAPLGAGAAGCGDSRPAAWPRLLCGSGSWADVRPASRWAASVKLIARSRRVSAPVRRQWGCHRC